MNDNDMRLLAALDEAEQMVRYKCGQAPRPEDLTDELVLLHRVTRIARTLFDRAQRAEAAVARVEALAYSLVWKMPEPCPDADSCCGGAQFCEARIPSVKAVGYREIRAALAGE